MPTHSASPKRKVTRPGRGCAYVLWGDGFDEVLAVTFVTELRKAGLQVKLVGLRQQPMVGAYGVTLRPEIALEEALAKREHLSCLVIPCDEVGWQRLQQEPRLCQLFTRNEATQIPLLSCQPAAPRRLTAFQHILITSAGDALQRQVQQIVAMIKAT